MNYTQTEQRVLSAMALETAVTLADARRNFPNENVKGVLTTYTSVLQTVNSRARRKVSERNVSFALESLTRRGDVIRDAPFGMTPTFKLNADLTEQADRRYNR